MYALFLAHGKELVLVDYGGAAVDTSRDGVRQRRRQTAAFGEGRHAGCLAAALALGVAVETVLSVEVAVGAGRVGLAVQHVGEGALLGQYRDHRHEFVLVESVMKGVRCAAPDGGLGVRLFDGQVDVGAIGAAVVRLRRDRVGVFFLHLLVEGLDQSLHRLVLVFDLHTLQEPNPVLDRVLVFADDGPHVVAVELVPFLHVRQIRHVLLEAPRRLQTT